MAAVVPNEGERAALDILLLPEHGAKVGLFINDMAPDADSVYDDFDRVTTTTFYFSDLGDEVPSVTSGSGRAKKSYVNVTFTRATTGTPETVYGWYIRIENPADTYFVWMAKRFDTPIVLTNAGDKVSFDLDLFATEVAS